VTQGYLESYYDYDAGPCASESTPLAAAECTARKYCPNLIASIRYTYYNDLNLARADGDAAGDIVCQNVLDPYEGKQYVCDGSMYSECTRCATIVRDLLQYDL
jgi:hypothetical protein